MPIDSTDRASSPTLDYALELAVANELSVKGVYQELADREANAELREVWTAMAKAEQRHADLLTEIKMGLGAATLGATVDFSLRPFDSFARQVDDFREQLEAGTLGRDEIFRFVLQLELGEQNGVLLELLSACPSPVVSQLEHDVAAPSDRHLHVLLNVIENRCHDQDLRAQVRSLQALGSV